MATELSSLFSFNVPVTIKDGNGAVLTKFNVKRKAIGFDEWEEIQRRQTEYREAKKESQDAESLKEVKDLLSTNLLQMLSGWDLVEGQAAVTLDKARLESFDAGILSQMHEQVMDHANPNPKKSEAV